MLVFKKNWLYKYNNWCSGNFATIDNVNDSKSICPYFWKSLWNLLGTNMIYIILAHVPSVMGIWITKVDLFNNLSGIGLLYTSLVVGYLCMILFFLCIFCCVIVQDNVKKLFKSKGEKSNNIVIEYIKAKKSKICPMIKWED